MQHARLTSGSVSAAHGGTQPGSTPFLSYLRCMLQAESIHAAGGHAVGVQCDVCDMDAQRRAFDDHAARHGSLNIAVLNAGILEQGEHSLGLETSAVSRR